MKIMELLTELLKNLDTNKLFEKKLKSKKFSKSLLYTNEQPIFI